MFALGIEFLTGTAVMTAADSRDTAEWPPHPARVFMALVAAHYETRPLPEDGQDEEVLWNKERQCLEWLEQQGAPDLSCPKCHSRTVVKVYVPVNDSGLPSDAAKVKPTDMRWALGIMPEFRSRQERCFPSVNVGLDAADRFTYLIWREASLPEELSIVFTRLASKVVRVGHSSSFVRLWSTGESTLPPVTLTPHQTDRRVRNSHSLRISAPGFLKELDQRFNADDIDAYFDLNDKLETAKGKAKEAAKEAFKSRFGEEWRKNLPPPTRLRPTVGLSQVYVPPEAVETRPVEGVFDSEILVLTKQEGPVLGLEATDALIEALRGTLLVGSEEAPEWFTGHKTPGLPATRAHLALLPLAYVGADFADGHILGLALAFPREVPPKDRAAQLKRILYKDDGSDRTLTLTLGRTGEWTLRREERMSPPISLKAETWTDASNVWASVTPVVLDRHPKHDPRDPNEREAWRQEVVASIIESCAHIGLPRPSIVDVDKTSWHRGAPRSRPGPGGMPWLKTKTGAPRQQIHVLLQFESEVQGPVLLGAGRYRGYGLCKPLGYPSK